MLAFPVWAAKNCASLGCEEVSDSFLLLALGLGLGTGPQLAQALLPCQEAGLGTGASKGT